MVTSFLAFLRALSWPLRESHPGGAPERRGSNDGPSCPPGSLQATTHGQIARLHSSPSPHAPWNEQHPSELNSSTIATDEGVALIEESREAACGFRDAVSRASAIASMGRNCIGTPPAKRRLSDAYPRKVVTHLAPDMSCNQNVPLRF
jgi:hypothetical protein